MRLLAVILVFILLESNAMAQTDPMKWGKFSSLDFSSKGLANDSLAKAVVLCDYGNLSVEPLQNDFRVVFYRHVRIRILSKAGYDKANVAIYLNKEVLEEVTDIRAHSITPDGLGHDTVITELRDADILRKQETNTLDKVVFAIPAVQVGSVIEYSYKLISSDFFNYRTWVFQQDVPVLWSELRVELSGIYNYQVLFHNIPDSLFINQKTYGFSIIQPETIPNSLRHESIRIKTTFARYVMKDIPALLPEPFITCMDDYQAEIRFQLMSITKPFAETENIARSWDELARLLSEDQNFGHWLNGDGELRRLPVSDVKRITSPKERMNYLYNYVCNSFRWNGEYHLLAGQPVTDMLRSRSGNSVEINLLLLKLMQMAGLKADPVLISTRKHGKVQKSHPLLSQFNHVICQVTTDSATFLLDATARYLPCNLLAADDLNYFGLDLSGRNCKWIDIPQPAASKRNSLLILRIDSTGNLAGNLLLSSTGHYASRIREEIGNDGQEKYVQSLLGFLSLDINVDSSLINNLGQLDKPLKLVVFFSATHVLKYLTKNDVIYFDAQIFNAYRENPLKPAHRNYPVDFNYPFEDASTLVVEIPEGYAIEETPQPEHVMMPDSSAEFTFKLASNMEVFQVKSELKCRKSLFMPGEYADLKALFDAMVQKNSEHIIAIRDE